MKHLATYIALAAALTLPYSAGAQTTFMPDANYGKSGTIFTAFDVNVYNGNATYRSGVLLPDGKLLLGGHTQDSLQSSYISMRRGTSGAADVAYGLSGGIQENLTGGKYDELCKLLYDGTYTYMVGTHHDSSAPQPYSGRFGVVALHSDGTRHIGFNGSSFTIGEVEVAVPLGAGTEGVQCTDATFNLAKDKMILVGTTLDGSYASTRISVSGVPDFSGYGSNALVIEKDSSHLNYYTTSVLQSANGSIYAAGYTEDPNAKRKQFFVTKRLSNGWADTAFHHTGYAYTNLDSTIGYSADMTTDDLVQLPNGNLILVGHQEIAIILTAYDGITGDPVSSFGSWHNGIEVLGSMLTTQMYEMAAAVDANGNINIAFGSTSFYQVMGPGDYPLQYFFIMDGNGNPDPYSGVEISRIAGMGWYNGVHDLIIDPKDGSRYIIGATGASHTDTKASIIKLLPTPVGITTPSPTTSKVNVYPNPARTYITIDLHLKEGNYAIYDMVGRNVTPSTDLTGNKINISMLPIGTYILKAKTTDGISSTKFLKE